MVISSRDCCSWSRGPGPDLRKGIEVVKRSGESEFCLKYSGPSRDGSVLEMESLAIHYTRDVSTYK